MGEWASLLTSFQVTCDPIGNAEEPRRPLPLYKWFPVIPISKAHAQEFLAHRLVPESIDQRVADGTGKGQPSGPGLQGWGDTVLPPEGLRGDDNHVGAPSRPRTLEAGERWARLAQARAASRPGLCAL